MLRHWILAVSVVSVLAGTLFVADAQIVNDSQSSATVDRDIRVFTVTAALNVAGFDVEFAPQYHPVREAVRERLESIDPDLRTRLAEYYAENRGDTPHEDELARYVSLALNLSYPPDMDFVTDDLFIPPDARDLDGFLPLLNEFYFEADISQMWVQLAPVYDQVLDVMAGPLRQTVVETRAYLRAQVGAIDGRRLIAYLELSAPVNSVHVRNYTDNLYLVFGYDAQNPVDDVRHGYLHVALDAIVRRSREELVESNAMVDWVRDIEGVRSEYTDDFEVMVTESLIQAVEMRIDGDADNVDSLVDTAYRSGLLLTPYFMDSLARFEQTPVGIREYFPEMALEIELQAERERFDERFHAIALAPDLGPLAEVPEPPPSNPVQDLLLEAQAAFNSGDDNTARTAFETVLAQYDDANGPALYGLALLASREGDSEIAKDFFRQTIESESAELPMRAWSHVFLGRILDIECDRAAALVQYEAGAGFGDDTNGAQAAARNGIEAPFSDGCGL